MKSADIIKLPRGGKPMPFRNLDASANRLKPHRAQCNCMFRRNGQFCYPVNDAARNLTELCGVEGWILSSDMERIGMFVEIEYVEVR